ncbi:hypothetical protein [Psychrobacillus psychrodurans]|uniref:hypothetical protein n=1 Tax=Psychrobacillus psychrodurans TaxID=126157 RepID=UPI003D06DAE5
MNDIELKQMLKKYKVRYGASNAYMGRRCGVSREHISRWVNNDNYHLSKSLQKKLYKY